MNKGRMIAALALLMLTTSAFAFSGRAPYVVALVGLGGSARAGAPPAERRQASPGRATPRAGSHTPEDAQATDAPKHVVYGLLFREVASFKKIAREKELKGEDGSFLHRHHKENLKLDDAQAEALRKVAEETDREARKLDREARKIIDKERARHPDGRLRDGESPPPPPAELTALQRQRDAVVMKGREELRAALGDTEFQRFDETVQLEVTKRMKPVQEDPRATRAQARQ